MEISDSGESKAAYEQKKNKKRNITKMLDFSQ